MPPFFHICSLSFPCCFRMCKCVWQGVCYRLLYCLLCNVIYTHPHRQRFEYNVINGRDTKAIPHGIKGRQNKWRRRKPRSGMRLKAKKNAFGITDKLVTQQDIPLLKVLATAQTCPLVCPSKSPSPISSRFLLAVPASLTFEYLTG